MAACSQAAARAERLRRQLANAERRQQLEVQALEARQSWGPGPTRSNQWVSNGLSYTAWGPPLDMHWMLMVCIYYMHYVL